MTRLRVARARAAQRLTTQRLLNKFFRPLPQSFMLPPNRETC